MSFRTFNVFLPSNYEFIMNYSPNESHPFTVEGEVIPVLIDTVYYSPATVVDAEEVKNSLIDHDNYPHEIRVVEATN